MKIRIISLILALLMLAAAFTACNQPNAPDTEKATEAATEQAPAETKEAGTKEAEPAPGPKKVQAADLLEDFKAREVADKAADEAFKAAAFDWAARLFSQVYQQEKSQKEMYMIDIRL